MASVSKRVTPTGLTSWDVRYRDRAGRQRSKTFRRAVDARKFAAVVDDEMSRGHLNVADGRMKVGELAERLHATKSLKPKSMLRERTTIDRQVLPRWGNVRLSAVSHLDVLEWVAGMADDGLDTSSIRKARGFLSEVFALAVRSGIVASNPVDGVKVRSDTVKRPIRPLSVDELDSLVVRLAARRPDVAMLVEVAAMTGLRQGELLALRADRVDLEGGVITVDSQDGNLVNLAGRMQFGSPKGNRGRTVPIVSRLVEPLGRYLEGVDRRGLLWTNTLGKPVDAGNLYQRVYWPAVLSLGFAAPPPDFHDLRHTFASLMIAAGISPKALQLWLGHSSIKVTFDVYGHLMTIASDDTVERFDALLERMKGKNG